MKIQIAFICLIGATWVYAAETIDKRQVGTAVVDNKEDHQGEESAFGHHVAASGKYFQDMYMAQLSPEELEFGHVCETPSDWEQRFEKINLAESKHQGKVRWGDKHGGYGEHYWDYNHAGHHDHDGHHEESKQEPEYAQYEEESKQVPQQIKLPTYTALPSAKLYATAVAPSLRGKREPADDVNDDVEFINERARSLVFSGASSKHGGNYKAAPSYERGKREGKEINGRNLVFEPSTGLIVDEKTGVAYRLQVVDDY